MAEIVEILPAAGTDPNVKGNASSMPLYRSTLCGSYDMSTRLLGRGVGVRPGQGLGMDDTAALCFGRCG